MRLVLIAAALALSSSVARAEGFGRNIENWSFSRAEEGKDVFNCRATRRAQGREDILAERTTHSAYVSVKGEGRQGKFPDTTIWPLNEPKTGRKWIVKAEANRERLWFPLPDAAAAETIAQAGGFEFLIGNSEESGRVLLGDSAAAAWDRVQECIAK